MDVKGVAFLARQLQAEQTFGKERWLTFLAEQAKRQAQERIALAEEKAARVAAERASQRLAFLAEASGTLASSLDLEATLREISRLVVPRLADVSIVSLVAGEGQCERHEMAWTAGSAEHPLLTASLPETGTAALDEALQIDLARLLGCERGELFVLDDDEASATGVVTAHDLLALECAVVLGAAVASLQRGTVAREHARTLALGARRIQIDRHAHQPKGDGARPESPRCMVVLGFRQCVSPSPS